MFADLTGFSTMTTALMALGQYGAETLAALMRDLFNPMISCVYENGGMITTFSGDSFTALFQIEAQSADAYHSALYCAAHIQEIVSNSYNEPDQQSYYQQELTRNERGTQGECRERTPARHATDAGIGSDF